MTALTTNESADVLMHNGQGWQEVTLLRDYTRREAMDEMATYKGANPGSSFKLLVMEREDRE